MSPAESDDPPRGADPSELTREQHAILSLLARVEALERELRELRGRRRLTSSPVAASLPQGR